MDLLIVYEVWSSLRGGNAMLPCRGKGFPADGFLFETLPPHMWHGVVAFSVLGSCHCLALC